MILNCEILARIINAYERFTLELPDRAVRSVRQGLLSRLHGGH